MSYGGGGFAHTLTYLVPSQPPTFNLQPSTSDHHPPPRILTCFLLSFTCQTKFVFAWKISEASLTAAGLNFDGWDDVTGKPKWWVGLLAGRGRVEGRIGIVGGFRPGLDLTT